MALASFFCERVSPSLSHRVNSAAVWGMRQGNLIHAQENLTSDP